MVDPQQQEMIDKIYTQTLNRTYVNTFWLSNHARDSLWR